jgi:O-antigen ligase
VARAAVGSSRPFVVSGLISAVALTLTSSRGALISLGVGLLVLVALRLRRETERRGWWLAPIAATVAAGVVLVVAQPSLGDRPAYWHVAASDVARRPVLGSGAGTFDDVWYANRPITASVRDAHSLYLEVLAELGPVGLLLLLGILVPPLLAAARTADASIVPIAAAGYAAFLFHAGLDWDWEMPATTLAGLACGAALLVSIRTLSVS